MDTAAILAIVTKGLSIAEAVWENRDLAFKAIESVKKILNRGSEVTQADIDATEADLDALLTEFNADLPPEAAT